MAVEWNEAALQQYIDGGIEESSYLEYKAADALERTEGKRKEITKDVSAMANAAGGTVIYGIKEYDDPDKKHLPEAITPINRTQFSKEWLEQVINNIRPRISNVLIHPVSLSSGPNNVAYVVEVPQSNTAHQALDFRYYRRFNFQVLPMEDYEIRDVMNRASSPEASVEFQHIRKQITSSVHNYQLNVVVKNLGTQVITHFQLEFTFPLIVGYTHNLIHKKENIDLRSSQTHNHLRPAGHNRNTRNREHAVSLLQSPPDSRSAPGGDPPLPATLGRGAVTRLRGRDAGWTVRHKARNWHAHRQG